MKSTITLSKKNVMQVIALSALLPIPLNFIIIYLNPIAIFTNFYDKATWITFCGNYMGGLMGGIVSLIILNKTLKQTSIQHEELKRIQINTITYTQKQEWLNNLKIRLTRNLRNIDLYILNTVVSDLRLHEYDHCKEILQKINYELENQVTFSYFDFSETTFSKEEEKFIMVNKLIYLEYTSLIRDLLYYVPLAANIHKGNPLTYEELMDYTLSQYDYISINNHSQYALQKSIILQVQELNPNDNLKEELERIVEKRLTFRTNLYQLKKELMEVTHSVIHYEVEEINKLLIS
jgi:hypothetical protein